VIQASFIGVGQQDACFQDILLPRSLEGAILAELWPNSNCGF
jgi:hypothetical protein